MKKFSNLTALVVLILSLSCRLFQAPALTETPAPDLSTQTSKPAADTLSPPTETAAPTYTHTPTSTKTPIPTPTVPPASLVQMVCLEVHASIPEQERQISGTIASLMPDSGPRFNWEDQQGCDAEMLVNLDLNALSSQYLDQNTNQYKTCYTGATASGELVYKAPGSESLVFSIQGRKNPKQGLVFGCTSEEYAPYSDAWGVEIFYILYNLRGMEILPEALNSPQVGSGLEPVLEEPVMDLYEQLGADALPTAPRLIEFIARDYPSAVIAAQALAWISGEDYGVNYDLWDAWWDRVQSMPMLTPTPIAEITTESKKTPSLSISRSPTEKPQAQSTKSKPASLLVLHDPGSSKFEPGGSSGMAYTCQYATMVKARFAGVTIQEFGMMFWENGRWVYSSSNEGKPWSSEDFSDWYSCPDAYVPAGEECNDPNNWTGSNSGEALTGLWYYRGVDDFGNPVEVKAQIYCQAAD